MPSASGQTLDINWSEFLVTISNCTSYAEIYCNGGYEGGATGGIVGYGYATQVENCINHGSLSEINSSSSSFGGGIVGALFGGNISKCSNYGQINLNASSYSEPTQNRRFDVGAGGISGLTIGIVNECQNHATINGTNAGGISGYGGTIDKCANFGAVNGSQIAGGISASNIQSMILYLSIRQSGQNIYVDSTMYVISGNINNCFNSGEVTAGTVGGIIGYSGAIGATATQSYINNDMTLTTTKVANINLANNYNIGKISSTSTDGYAGGIVGAVMDDGQIDGELELSNFAVPLKIINNFNVGAIEGANKGGIIGDIGYGDIEISKNYFADSSLSAVGTDNSWSLQSDAVYLENLAELAKTQEWYANNFDEQKPWDFALTWSIDPEQNDGYPILSSVQGMGFWTDDGVRATSFAGGNGEESTPYQISSGAELAYLSYMTQNGTYYENQYFVLTQNIDLSGYYWDPIDNFKGNFNGQNYEISHLTTEAYSVPSIPDENWMIINEETQKALFGNISGYLENIILKDSAIYGSAYTGGIVASCDGSNSNRAIRNCINYADIHSYIVNINNNSYNSYGVGGILGGCRYGGGSSGLVIENCINYGNIYVSGTNVRAGGIVGSSVGIDVSGCENYGTIVVNATSTSGCGESYSGGGVTIGGIVGSIDYSCDISQSRNYGSIDANVSSSQKLSNYTYAGIGGIIGAQQYSNNIGLKYLANYGTINFATSSETQFSVGGLIGVGAFDGLMNSYNSGEIISEGKSVSVGGIVGSVSNQYSNSMTFIYNIGNIQSQSSAGGILGQYNYTVHGPFPLLGFINVINIGNINGESGKTGEIIGRFSERSSQNEATIQILSVYYANNSNEEIGTGDKLGATYLPNLSSLAKTQEWYLSDTWAGGWNFYSLWGFVEGENDGYPVFTSTIQGNWIDEEYRGTSFGGGTGTEEDPYIISTPEHLAYLSYLVNNNLAEGDSMDMGGGMIMKMQFSGVYFEQRADIDLSAHVWNAIGNLDMVNQAYLIFSGNYDGGGYKITGMFTDGSDYIGGLFGVVCGLNDNITLKNINIAESYIQNMGAAGVVGMMMLVSPSVQINVENCHNSAVVIGTTIAGGIIAGGESAGGSIVDCGNTGNILGLSYAGGIIGQLSHSTSPLTIDNVYNEGSVTGSYAGGIVSDTNDTTLTNSHNTGNIFGINSNGYVGGLIGDSYETTLDNCYNTGSISGKAQYAGGVVASLGGSSGISNSYNSGDVNVGTNNSTVGVGGVVGYAVFQTYENPLSINNCINYGNVTSDQINTGGVAGYSAYGSDFENCVNYGDISGTQYVGGIAGDGVVDNSLNYGDISGTSYVGGISGRGRVNNSSNYGAVSGTQYVGGIAGYMNQSYVSSSTSVSTILTLKNYGPVSATGNYAGGLIGQFVVSNSSTLPTITLSGCINLGSVTSSGDYVGGFVGHLNVSGSTESYPVTFTIEGSGIESAITYGGTNHGVLIGLSTIPVTLTNSYAISQIADLTLVGSADITMTNNLFILNDVKYYQGDDFSEFAWINSSSCPIPKALSTMSDYFTGTVTLDDLTSDGWTELTVA